MKKAFKTLTALTLFGACLFSMSSCEFIQNLLGKEVTPPDVAQTHQAATDETAKKGVCVSRYNVHKSTTVNGDKSTKINDLNMSWYWNWSIQPDPNITAEFVPQVWGASNVTTDNIQKLKDLKNAGKIKYVLTFNEPEINDGGNLSAGMTNEQIFGYWPQLESIGLPLSTPAFSGYDETRKDNHLDNFIKEAKTRNARVDFISLHFYQKYYDGQSQIDHLKSVLTTIYNRYEMPIWLTEFGAMDAAYSEQNTSSAAKQTQETASYYAQNTPKMLESLGFVQRYSWFVDNFDQKGGLENGKYDPLYNDDDTLSTTGTKYKGVATSVAMEFKTPSRNADGTYKAYYANFNKSFQQEIKVAGGYGDYTFKAAYLPNGLKISKGGVIYGKPTESGDSYATITATDAKGQSISLRYLINVKK